MAVHGFRERIMAVDDSYTVALLHMDGADASTTFTDESGKTWTANGNAQIDDSVASPLTGGNEVGLFDGAGDYLTTPDHADWQLDGGSNSNEWTVDLRVRFTALTTARGLVQQRADDSNFWSIAWTTSGLNMLIRSAGSNIVNIDFAWTPSLNTWYHVAMVKQGATGYKAFVDGTQIGSTTTDTDPMPDFAGELRIGRYNPANLDFAGQMEELRISKGIARWTANFTPPTSAYAPPSVSGSFFFF
jgi:hypothetical protein